MIRIDEIYSNVFLPTVQHRPRIGLHWFDPFGSVDIKHICNVPPVDGTADLRIVFWDQEPVYRETVSQFMEQFQKTYQGPCLLVTSEKNSSDLAWAQSTYGISSAYYFFHGWAALDWYRGYDHSFLAKPWRERSFLHQIFCPNNIISGRRQHRVRLVSDLCRRGLLENNLVSFPAVCPFSQQSVQELCQDIGVMVPDIKLPLIIDHAVNHAHDSHRIDFWNQATASFCHVVTETVYDDNRLHLTEKTFKPIVLEQPFVLVGPRYSLSYLREYGFKTFDAVWDESYDQLPDSQRLDAIVDILEEINSWSVSRTAQAQREIAATVRHNRDWFYGAFQELLWVELNGMIDNWR